MDFSHPAAAAHGERLLEKPGCPICASTLVTPFVRRERVPLLTNLVVADQESALRVPRGDITLVVCEHCGFVFNSAFEFSALYNEQYDNAQVYAPSFAQYLADLVHSLVTERHVQQCRIVEVGCGDGFFLRKLVETGAGNTGWGFDPSYRGPALALDGRVQFEARYYDEHCAGIPADVLISRHVIEHIADPLSFLRTIHRALANAPQARVFFETPCIAWILQNKVIWDIYYEHCSYFDAETITLALELSGFKVEQIRRVFGDQYLWIEASVCETARAPLMTAAVPGSIPALAAHFEVYERQCCERWERTVQELAKDGPVALLGAAGKGVALANLIDPDRQLISCVADLNPRKQGHFLPGTGHPIVSYEQMKMYGITTGILLNPNYHDDTVRLLQQHQLHLRLVVDDPVPVSVAIPAEREEREALALLAARVEQVRRRGKTIVFTNGVFDLLHIGHVQFLRQAKALGDLLIVAVDSDASTRRLKGPGRPVHSERDRMMLIAALDMVDHVLLFEGETLSDLIRLLRPHVYVKGGEYRGTPSPAAEALREVGGQAVITPLFRSEMHTSRIIERILALAPGA